MSSASQKVIVERCYEAQEEACSQAVTLLLQKATGGIGGEEDPAGEPSPASTQDLPCSEGLEEGTT